MANCLNCKNFRVTKDFEFNVFSNDLNRSDIPCGKSFVNIDLYWCPFPEQDDYDFQILSFGSPSEFNKNKFFSILAGVCNNYCEY